MFLRRIQTDTIPDNFCCFCFISEIPINQILNLLNCSSFLSFSSFFFFFFVVVAALLLFRDSSPLSFNPLLNFLLKSTYF